MADGENFYKIMTGKIRLFFNNVPAYKPGFFL